MTRAPERVAGGRRPRSSADPDLLLGRYRLRGPIGEGATSTVWLAHDERLDRPVAVKVLRPGLLTDPGARRRLRDEARSVARLGHPNVVGVHDVAIGQDRAAIVLEHVPGRSLLERLREGPMAPSAALRIGAEIAAGLAAAHRLGIVHRDVKPANVLLGDDGRARLADFGIATALGEAATADAGGIAGSLRYLAPERLRGEASSPAADVWSAGVVAFRMLSGRMPFSGSSARELHDAAVAGPPSLHDPAVPGDAANAIGRALDPDPARRPSAGDLAAALAAAAASVPVARVASAASVAGVAAQGRADASATRRAERAAERDAAPALVASAIGHVPHGREAGSAGSDDSPTLPVGAVGPAAGIGPAAAGIGLAAAAIGPAVARIRSHIDGIHPAGRSRRAAAGIVAAAGATFLAAVVLAGLIGGHPSPPAGVAGALRSPASNAATAPAPSGTPRPTARPTPTPAPGVVVPARHPRGHGHGHGGRG